MSKMRVFVSSTCYDLAIIRSELRPFINTLGYEPVMSDYSDILYDPRFHTHDSCIKEIPNCDMVILIIGSRFGGTGLPSAIDNVDIDILRSLSSSTELLNHKDKFSITQLEIFKAVEVSIPIYVFVDEKVLHDHHVYEKNKNKELVMAELEFPSIGKRETAKYIFEFINFMSHRTYNNSICPFGKLDDIKLNLINQWSQLFQQLLYESRTHQIESKRYQDFSEKLDDLKAVIMASISSPNLRDTAKGAIQFRHLISFLFSFRVDNIQELLVSSLSWDDLFAKFGIVEVRTIESDARFNNSYTYLIKSDRSFYKSRYSKSIIEDLKIEWDKFLQLEHDTRKAIVFASLEDRDVRRVRNTIYFNKDFDEFIDEKESESISNVSIISDHN